MGSRNGAIGRALTFFDGGCYGCGLAVSFALNSAAVILPS